MQYRKLTAALAVALLGGVAFVLPCLALGQCPVKAAADCHEEDGQEPSTGCCELSVLPTPGGEAVKLLVALSLVTTQGESLRTPQEISAESALIPHSHSPPQRGAPLFIVHSSFLI